tara:strand:+ start:556 stop:813 length:258 start_codon:yes stop_codon:yes gene_type:complete
MNGNDFCYLMCGTSLLILLFIYSLHYYIIYVIQDFNRWTHYGRMTNEKWLKKPQNPNHRLAWDDRNLLLSRFHRWVKRLFYGEDK